MHTRDGKSGRRRYGAVLEWFVMLMRYNLIVMRGIYILQIERGTENLGSITTGAATH